MDKIQSHGGKRTGSGRKTHAEEGDPGHYERYNAARAKREEHNARIAEFEERKLAGDLLEKAEVSAGWQRMAGTIRARLLVLPAKIAPLVIGLESIAEVEAVIADAIHEALRELSGAT